MSETTAPETPPSLTLQAIIKQRAALLEQQRERERAHRAAFTALQEQLTLLRKQEAWVVRQLNLERVRLGLEVIEVYGEALSQTSNTCDGHRAAVLEEAKLDLVSGAHRLQRRYFAVKNDAEQGDQRCDGEYHTAPDFGSIVFSIGLTRRLRARIDAAPLNADEIESALHVLASLCRLQSTTARDSQNVQADPRD